MLDRVDGMLGGMNGMLDGVKGDARSGEGGVIDE